MSNKFEVTLSNGTSISIDPDKPKEMFKTIVKDVLIPFYKESNDWNESIRKAINVLDFIRSFHNLPNVDYRQKLLDEIEKDLKEDIDKMEGVDKIEILFLNMDDYLEEIDKIMKSADLTKADRVRAIGDLAADLNGFEISELLFHYVEKAYKK
jgi:hypothetical protein